MIVWGRASLRQISYSVQDRSKRNETIKGASDCDGRWAGLMMMMTVTTRCDHLGNEWHFSFHKSIHVIISLVIICIVYIFLYPSQYSNFFRVYCFGTLCGYVSFFCDYWTYETWFDVIALLTVIYALAGVVEDTVKKFKADNCEDNNCK